MLLVLGGKMSPTLFIGKLLTFPVASSISTYSLPKQPQLSPSVEAEFEHDFHFLITGHHVALI